MKANDKKHLVWSQFQNNKDEPEGLLKQCRTCWHGYHGNTNGEHT